jgi:hypothetical protein
VQRTGGAGSGEQGATEAAPPQQPEPEQPDDAAERAKARSKIWTPGS